MAVMDSSRVLKAAGAAGAAAPYVKRIMSDERLRDELRNIVRSASRLYDDLSGDDSVRKLVKDDSIRKDLDHLIESMQKAGQRAVVPKRSTNWAAIAIVSGIAGGVVALLVYPRTRHGIQSAYTTVRGGNLHAVEDVQENAA